MIAELVDKKEPSQTVAPSRSDFYFYSGTENTTKRHLPFTLDLIQ